VRATPQPPPPIPLVGEEHGVRSLGSQLHVSDTSHRHPVGQGDGIDGMRAGSISFRFARTGVISGQFRSVDSKSPRTWRPPHAWGVMTAAGASLGQAMAPFPWTLIPIAVPHTLCNSENAPCKGESLEEEKKRRRGVGNANRDPASWLAAMLPVRIRRNEALIVNNCTRKSFRGTR